MCSEPWSLNRNEAGGADFVSLKHPVTPNLGIFERAGY